MLYKLPLYLFPESTYLASLTRTYKPDPRKDDPIPRLPLVKVNGDVYHVMEDVTSTELDALLSILTPSYVHPLVVPTISQPTATAMLNRDPKCLPTKDYPLY